MFTCYQPVHCAGSLLLFSGALCNYSHVTNLFTLQGACCCSVERYVIVHMLPTCLLCRESVVVQWSAMLLFTCYQPVHCAGSLLLFSGALCNCSHVTNLFTVQGVCCCSVERYVIFHMLPTCSLCRESVVVQWSAM